MHRPRTIILTHFRLQQFAGLCGHRYDIMQFDVEIPKWLMLYNDNSDFITAIKRSAKLHIDEKNSVLYTIGCDDNMWRILLSNISPES